MGWEDTPALDWTVDDVRSWLEFHGLKHLEVLVCNKNHVDGKTLLMIQEEDVRRPPLQLSTLGDIKHFMYYVNSLKGTQKILNQDVRVSLGLVKSTSFQTEASTAGESSSSESESESHGSVNTANILPSLLLCSSCSSKSRSSRSNISSRLEPERWKTALALMYILCVSWLTAITMTVVHDRVPDMNKYPPLPDIILDNIPHISWAFEMSEVAGMTLLIIWCIVLLFHTHRFILARRFFSISGTIFLLRCVTMLITSLSVPGVHLDCKPAPYGAWTERVHAAYVIWSGAGMSIQGVRTCGDYIFSGHTVSLTLLNFFITEYTSRRIYFLHTFTWVCNCFGIFFILAAHEHYSIDVFIAFYITSRLFLYYHTLVNNRTLFRSHQGQDSKRTWFYFPLFSFFEQNIDGRVPNEFSLPFSLEQIKNHITRFSCRFSEISESISGRPRTKSRSKST
ncbi:sphingomyelin synthase-related protein 1 [Eurytemora carolleeae]|uniref:sphingomyelin synthase-related protein 1 n=1 Tax=Eurytemora carolleeae TaxID=1294199 RepID=UPI000C786A7F|nr:sphingomyelin synthase-related protein 1 [Eurytemora carolleeae]|eukprot:XP_023335231.1 sphingomyelin synthase-related protein 1-like [Eurytemora affinis]